jgi:hypothetical protein
MDIDDRNLLFDLTSEAPAKKKSHGEGDGARSHLIPLPGGDWDVWRCVGLRGAGFPAAQVRALAAEDCSQAADDLICAEDEVQKTQALALASVRRLLDALREAGQWDENDKRAPLVKALRYFRDGKIPSLPGLDEMVPEAGAYRAALNYRQGAIATYHRCFERDTVRLGESLGEVAQSGRFREAVIWQNRHAFHTALVPFLRQSAQSGRSGRKGYKDLIANYLQRYCVKNDTIGFFGPVGWAQFVPQGEALRARSGDGLLATRRVYFETWCIDALAQKLSENRDLRPWLTPRRVPYLYLKGSTLCLPLARPLPLPQPLALALQLCDGERNAREVALLLSRMCPTEVSSEAQGYELLEQLRAKGLILWKLEVATGPFPERILRHSLEGIGDESLRAAALEDLDQLERRRDAVTQAAGDAERLDHALGDLDESFSRLSGQISTRAHGEMYAARTLVYEDCRRDTEVDLGPDLLHRLGPPLTLLLTSARWYTHQIAQFYRETFARIYAEVSQLQGTTEVDCPTFWHHAQPHVMEKERNASRLILPAFQQRWADILALSEEQRRVHYTVEELRPLVNELFAAPDAGWATARHHSPDVMIAAVDQEAIRRGQYQLVLGECHLGANTLRNSLFVAQHPAPEELYRALEADLPENALSITTPKSWPSLTSRTTPILLPRSSQCVLVTHDSIRGPEMKHVLEIGSLVVTQEQGRLLVKSRDGRLSYDIIEAFSDLFYMQTVTKFKLREVVGHTPRVTIGDLVVLRESWAYGPEGFTFAFIKNSAERFLAARRWAREHALPRFVFAKSPIEKKPIYVDFASPIYVDILAKVIRRTARVGRDQQLILISEMLPTHEQLWLSDAEGQRYTSELRIVALCN